MARWPCRPGQGLLVHTDPWQLVRVGSFPGRAERTGLYLQHEPQGQLLSVNAFAGSFFRTLKTKLIHHRRSETWEQAIFEYIEVF
jgi:hypothetical protein